jgi:hypothetical protein
MVVASGLNARLQRQMITAISSDQSQEKTFEEFFPGVLKMTTIEIFNTC